MAEQYQSFQGREPNIDINLFPNAMNAGIAAGNNQKTTFGAIASGISQGIQGGVQTVQGIQQIQSNSQKLDAQAAQLQIDTDPNVIQAKKDKILAEAQQAENEAAAAQDQSAALAKKMEATYKAADATQKLSDLTVKDEITTALGDSSTPPAVLQGLFQKAAGAFSRDNNFTQQALAQAQGRIDPLFLDNYRSAFDAVEIEKKRVELAQNADKSIQAEALNREKDTRAATATLQTMSPPIRLKMQDKDYDPTKLDIVAASDLQFDPKTKMPLFDAEGKPVVAAKSNPLDTRYFATYNGKVIDTFGEVKGREAAKAIPDYQLGSSAIFKNGKKEAEQIKEDIQNSMQFQNTGLAAETNNLDRRLNKAGPSSTTPLAPSKESLEGKSLEEQQAIVARFNQQVDKLKAAPRRAREIVQAVNSNPLLSTQPPLVKALVSQESGGVENAKSPTGVKGLMQVTGDTYDFMARKYPVTFSKLPPGTSKTSPEASLLAGKMYLIDLLNTFNDLPLALAAYNVGPGVVLAAQKDTGKNATWEQIKPKVQKLVPPEKWKEVENYPEKVLKFYSYYNG